MNYFLPHQKTNTKIYELMKTVAMHQSGNLKIMQIVFYDLYSLR